MYKKTQVLIGEIDIYPHNNICKYCNPYDMYGIWQNIKCRISLHLLYYTHTFGTQVLRCYLHLFYHDYRKLFKAMNLSLSG